VVEAVDVIIRNAGDLDLLAMEWEGEYRRYRRLYRMAMDEAKTGRRIVLVAEVAGRIIGQIIIQLNRVDSAGTGYFYAFRVRPEWRGRGIGTRLIREAEAVLVRMGFRRALIAVARDNPRARQLYERLGYSFFAEDAGEWSFVDDRGQLQRVVEPSWLLDKALPAEPSL
jgi:ribosomal protein S18 acetylase RimI-like enzyme